MLLKLLIARETTEIRLKIEAATGGALMRPYRIVLVMTMFALARCPPLMHVEAFAAGHPPLTDLLRPTGYESEGLALAVCAGRFEFVLDNLILMILEQVAAKASRFRSDSETVLLGLGGNPRHV